MKAEKTRSIIADALFQLLKKYAFEDITINMICEEAGIGRSTFYRLFLDKHDVLVAFFTIRYDEISDRYPDPENYVHLMADYLSLLKDNKSFFKKAFTVTDQNSLTSHVYRAAKEYYKNHIEAAQKKPISEDMSLTIIAFASGVLAVTKEWIRNDFHTDPEVLARIIFEAMPAKMQVYFCDK